MVEGGGVLDALDELLAVLDVRAEVPDLRVEDVAQAVLAHELVGEDADAAPHLVAQVVGAPHLAEALDRVHLLLHAPHLHHEVGEVHAHLRRQPARPRRLLDVRQDSLAVVLRDVLGVVPQARVVTWFSIGISSAFFLLLAVGLLAAYLLLFGLLAPQRGGGLREGGARGAEHRIFEEHFVEGQLAGKRAQEDVPQGEQVAEVNLWLEKFESGAPTQILHHVTIDV